MLFVVYVLVVVYVISRLVKKPKEEPELFEREAHRYSGLHPEIFSEFLANMNLCRTYSGHPDIALSFLYKAIGYLEELALYAVSGDFDAREEMYDLIQRIGSSFELYLNAKNPKYLNNTIE